MSAVQTVKSATVTYGRDLAQLPSRLKRRAFRIETFDEMRLSADIASHNGFKRVSAERRLVECSRRFGSLRTASIYTFIGSSKLSWASIKT